MKFHETIAVIAICSGVLQSASLSVRAQSEVSSDAIGYYRTTLHPGFQSFSVSLVHSPVYSSKISGSVANTLFSSYSAANFGTLLAPNTAYYVEVTGGPTGTNDPFVGHRFEVDEAATISRADQVIVIDMAAKANTRGDVPNLADYYMEVRSHFTLNEVFDKNLLNAGSSVSNSDQLLLYNGTRYDTYYVLLVGGIRGWVLFGGVGSQDNRPLYPGQGILFNRKSGSAPLEIVLKGKVRANPFFQPLAPGFNLLSEAFPVSASPRDRNAAPGTFFGANTPNAADQIAIFNGTSYDTYYLFKVGSTTGWLKIGSGGLFTDTDIFNYRGSVFLRRISADADYRVPLQWQP